MFTFDSAALLHRFLGIGLVVTAGALGTWVDRKNAGPAMLVWFILEGAGIVASVAYFLEGSPIAVALVAFSIAAFWMNGPRTFDRE